MGAKIGAPNLSSCLEKKTLEFKNQKQTNKVATNSAYSQAAPHLSKPFIMCLHAPCQNFNNFHSNEICRKIFHLCTWWYSGQDQRLRVWGRGFNSSRIIFLMGVIWYWLRWLILFNRVDEWTQYVPFQFHMNFFHNFNIFNKIVRWIKDGFNKLIYCWRKS